MRWDLHDKAVRLAVSITRDIDLAHDAALQALEEVGDGPESHIMVRVRDRAKDAVRRRMRQPFVASVDMDTLPSADSTFDQAYANLEREHLKKAIGAPSLEILDFVDAGLTNLQIAAHYGVGEETVRRARTTAEGMRDIIRSGRELGEIARGN